MKSKKRLIKNTLIIAIGKCSTQVVSFFLLPLYTSILTNAEYGNFDYINSLVLFLMPFITFLMEEAMFRFLIDAENDEDKRKVISQSVIFIASCTIISTIILYIILSVIKYDFKIYLIGFIIVTIYNSLVQSFARGLGEIKLYSIGAFISSILTLILNVFFIVFIGIGFKGLILAFIIANIVSPTLIGLILKMWKYVSVEDIDKKQIKKMLKYSIPLVPNSVSWVIINISDRLIITPILGLGANGIYAIANKFPNIMNTFYGYFYTAWKEEASRAIKEKDSDIYYNAVYKALNRLLIAICIGLIAILPLIFGIFINKKFSDSYKYIPFLVISMYFSNISGFYGGIFSAKKDTKIMGTSTIISAIINVVLNLLFIKNFGLYCTSISTIIASYVVYIYRQIKLKKYIKLQKDTKFYLTSIVILILAIIIYYSNLIYMYISGFVICSVYCIYINKNIVVLFVSKIRRKK